MVVHFHFKTPRDDDQCVTSARAAAKETTTTSDQMNNRNANNIRCAKAAFGVMNDSSRVDSELPTMSINGLVERLSNKTQLSKASFTKKTHPIQ